MQSDDFNRVVARFPIASTMEEALRLYPDKSVIVFCHHKHILKHVDWLIANCNVSAWRLMTLHIDDGRIVTFMNEYGKSRGYERDKFVVVDYL